MNHSLQLNSFGVSLRPVRLADAEFIVNLRNSPHALGNVGDSATDTVSQEAWLQTYFHREDDYYFIAERCRDARPVGTVGVYDICGDTGEWGRWIVLPGIPAGAAIAWLAFHACFDLLRLQTVLGNVVESNKPVLAFHKKIGNPCVATSCATRSIGDKTVRMVAFRATRADWPNISARLRHYALAAERLL
jgi:RimJ/RimL family protein N-acetyltransferase